MDCFGNDGEVGSKNAYVVAEGTGGDEKDRGSEILEGDGVDRQSNTDIPLDEGFPSTAPHPKPRLETELESEWDSSCSEAQSSTGEDDRHHCEGKAKPLLAK